MSEGPGPRDSEGDGTRERRLKRRLGLAVLALALIGAVGILANNSGYLQSPPHAGVPSWMQATCGSIADATGPAPHLASGGNGTHAYFLIVEADPPSPFAGINGSYYVSTTQQWPTIDVKLGQEVSIHVINCASNETHGFQISYYDDNSVVAVQPGQDYNVTFNATRAGTFRVYCGIFCSIHPLMQDGALIVS